MSKKDLKALSDSELDALIEQGITHQEQHVRHSEEYQHGLNIVAEAKEEKAARAERSAKSPKGTGEEASVTADKIEDNKVQDMNEGKTTEINSPKGKAGSTNHKAVKPKPVGDDGSQKDVIPAENINTGLPGVEPAMAEETPENVAKKGGKDIKA